MGKLLGIDIGTSSCKAALFDLDGTVTAWSSQPYPVYYPNPGWAEQDPEEWWQAVCLCIREVLQTSGVDACEIKGIGVDGQSGSTIPIDVHGRVMHNTPIWLDTRGAGICRKAGDRIGEDRIFSLCGNPLKPSYCTPKILWFQQQLPDVYQNTYKFLQSNSFIVYRLTGKWSQDLSQGYGFHFFNMRSGSYDGAMCDAFGLHMEKFPEIFPCHGIVGEVTGAAAELTGLKKGTPVVAGGLDAACGTLGAGVVREGQTQEQGGQSGGMSICVAEPRGHRKLILGYHVVPHRWLLQGGTTGGGGSMKWLKQTIGQTDESFEDLDLQAGSIPPGSDGLLFLPYLAGERSPLWNENASGVFFGLSYDKPRGHLVRAVLEGVAYSLRHNLETAREAGVGAMELRAMGGSANSRLWTQIKADVTGKPIAVPSSDTATTLGAALLAGVGTG
ncbi:MAG TPA: carbohydrate kinase, partial [Clostridiales bacterium]|nr:carbohydrate kinase [Clostridiales bacterium]